MSPAVQTRFAPAPARLADPAPRGRGALVRRAAEFAARLPARALIALVRVYQHTLSPALPVLTLGGCACRFSPTCSHYAVGALRAHGAVAGTWLAFRRLLKCTPLHPGGFDPVPSAPPARRAAVRVR